MPLVSADPYAHEGDMDDMPFPSVTESLILPPLTLESPEGSERGDEDERDDALQPVVRDGDVSREGGSQQPNGERLDEHDAHGSAKAQEASQRDGSPGPPQSEPSPEPIRVDTPEPADRVVDKVDSDIRFDASPEPNFTFTRRASPRLVDEVRSVEEVRSPGDVRSVEEVRSPEKERSVEEIRSPKKERSVEEVRSPGEARSVEEVRSPEKERSVEEVRSPQKEQSVEEVRSPQKEQSVEEVRSPEKERSVEEVRSSVDEGEVVVVRGGRAGEDLRAMFQAITDEVGDEDLNEQVGERIPVSPKGRGEDASLDDERQIRLASGGNRSPSPAPMVEDVVAWPPRRPSSPIKLPLSPQRFQSVKDRTPSPAPAPREYDSPPRKEGEMGSKRFKSVRGRPPSPAYSEWMKRYNAPRDATEVENVDKMRPAPVERDAERSSKEVESVRDRTSPPSRQWQSKQDHLRMDEAPVDEGDESINLETIMKRDETPSSPSPFESIRNRSPSPRPKPRRNRQPLPSDAPPDDFESKPPSSKDAYEDAVAVPKLSRFRSVKGRPPSPAPFRTRRQSSMSPEWTETKTAPEPQSRNALLEGESTLRPLPSVPFKSVKGRPPSPAFLPNWRAPVSPDIPKARAKSNLPPQDVPTEAERAPMPSGFKSMRDQLLSPADLASRARVRRSSGGSEDPSSCDIPAESDAPSTSRKLNNAKDRSPLPAHACRRPRAPLRLASPDVKPTDVHSGRGPTEVDVSSLSPAHRSAKNQPLSPPHVSRRNQAPSPVDGLQIEPGDESPSQEMDVEQKEASSLLAARRSTRDRPPSPLNSAGLRSPSPARVALRDRPSSPVFRSVRNRSPSPAIAPERRPLPPSTFEEDSDRTSSPRVTPGKSSYHSPNGSSTTKTRPLSPMLARFADRPSSVCKGQSSLSVSPSDGKQPSKSKSAQDRPPTSTLHAGEQQSPNQLDLEQAKKRSPTSTFRPVTDHVKPPPAKKARRHILPERETRIESPEQDPQRNRSFRSPPGSPPIPRRARSSSPLSPPSAPPPPQLSDSVKRALTRLPLHNVAVQIPDLELIKEATPNVMELILALEKEMDHERKRRSQDKFALLRPLRSILLVTASSRRADAWVDLLHKHSELGVAVRRPEFKNEATEKLFDLKNVVVTDCDTALKDAKANHWYLRRVAVLVFDVNFPEKAYRDEPSFSDRRHPCSYLMRDFYRAIPESRRPRVLAVVARERPLHELEHAPIEYNLFARFIPAHGNPDVMWKSCYGSGARVDDAVMMDVETIRYSPESYDDGETFMHRDRKRPFSSVKPEKDRRTMTDADWIREQVGPIGLALYQFRRRHRYMARRDGMLRTDHHVNEMFRHAHSSVVEGCSNKTLHLLSELQLAFAASTRDSRLSAIIYAGRPAVAAALGEVIRAMPVFAGLRVRVAIGCDGARSLETYGPDDTGEDDAWQSAESDDEAVASFAAGDTNVLIVSSEYTGMKKDQQPLTIGCSLIMRFDGSLPDSVVDGGGGRCRVITFVERNKKRESPRSSPVELAKEVTPAEKKAKVTRSSSTSSLSQTPEGDRKESSVSPERLRAKSDSESEFVGDEGEREVIKEPRAKRQKLITSFLDPEDSEPPFVYEQKPPRALLGPEGNRPCTCYLYQLLLYQKQSSGEDQPRDELPVRLGVEDFLFVLSEKLSQNDSWMPLKVGKGEENLAFVEVKFRGDVILKPKEIELARAYTTTVFSLAMTSLDSARFAWNPVESIDDHGDERDLSAYLRRYLVLPCARADTPKGCQGTSTPHKSDSLLDKEKVQSRPLIQKYFEASKSVSSVDAAELSPAIDWQAVNNLVQCSNAKMDSEKVYKDNGLQPDQFDQLEGKLILSCFGRETARLCGQLQYDACPLSHHIRARKFYLNKDGTFRPHADLVYLHNVESPEPTLRLLHEWKEKQRAKITEQGSQDEEKNAVFQEESIIEWPETFKKAKRVSVRWCSAENRLVRNASSAYRKRKRPGNVFNPARNAQLKRETWSGDVRYSYEIYNRGFNPLPVRTLDQPLLSTGRPRIATRAEIGDAVRGKPVSEICNRLVSQDGGLPMLVIPERCNMYPVPTGIVFLPALLQSFEYHVSICQLRRQLDPHIGITADLAELARAVTARHVNERDNYERLEFLGDAILKLSSTIRLFVSNPHDSEGQLHKGRSNRVNNEKLCRLGAKKGFFNHFRFHAETENDWMPPGTDIEAKSYKVAKKAMADVVESLCGAYFISGAYNVIAPHNQQNGEQGGRDGDEISPAIAKTTYAPLRGYETAYKFLEAVRVFEDKEPDRKEVLLAAIHAMHPKESPKPEEITASAFPIDRRLSSKAKWQEQFGPLEEAIDYKFKYRPLLLCALTHGSYVMQNGKRITEKQTFQRLEFLGDAIAEFCVVTYLYRKYPNLGPGDLTGLKGNVVSNEAFARITVSLGLHKYLYHSSDAYKGEIERFVKSLTEQQNGPRSDVEVTKRCFEEIAAPKVLGDIFEAILGAIYVDSGLKSAVRVCNALLRESLAVNADPNRSDLHPAIDLNKFVHQNLKLGTSSAEFKEENEAPSNGKPRMKRTTIYILGEKITTGRGTTSNISRRNAAFKALNFLRDNEGNAEGQKMFERLCRKSEELRVRMQRGYD